MYYTLPQVIILLMQRAFYDKGMAYSTGTVKRMHSRKKKKMSTLKLHTQHQETYESNLIFQRIRMKSTECEPAWCSGPLKR